LLKPDGIVEFLEIDPRPRLVKAGVRSDSNERKSKPQTDWTNKIVDRFKDPHNAELGTAVPGWMERVMKRRRATMSPDDRVVAANLNSWLEGAG
jgi:hypothetical protein